MRWPLIGRDGALETALEPVRSRAGVAILGPAGVGKTRLLDELAKREGAGRGIVNAVASESTRSIPFAPFVELLPGGPTPDRLAMLGAARAGLAARSGPRGLLLTVDDAHHLDDASLAFVKATVASGVATVALTVRTGEPMAADLVDLWTNGAIQRIDVGPLDRGASSRLLAETLGAVAPELEETLWGLSRGNALVLHELVEGAVGTSVQQDEAGVWVETGSLADSPRLSDLVRSRLRALPDSLRPAMDMVAVAAPLPLDIAREAMGDGLADLESRGLVTTTGSAGEWNLIPAHPLYGEILAAHIGEVRIQAAQRALVAAAGRVDHVIDPLRVAMWQRDGGEILSPELALAGAQAALVRHDPGLAEAILRPLGTDDDQVALLLGRALSYRQRFDEAEELLAGREPPDQALLGELASTRAQILGFGLGRVDEARALLGSVADRIDDPELRARLVNERAMVSAIHGDFGDSMSASRSALADPRTSVASRAAAYVTLTVALAMTGDCDGMDEIVDDALDVATRASEVLPFARDQVEIMRLTSFLNAGRLDEAVEVSERALASEDHGNAMITTWLSSSCMAHELTGQLARSASAARRALSLYADSDPFGLEVQTRGLLACARGQMGDPEAGESVDDVDPHMRGARLTIWLHRGQAWAAAVRGDLDRAVELVVQAGREGIDDEHLAWAAVCHSDAVRFGRAELVIDDLGHLDTSRGAHLLDAIKGHAGAAVAGDPAALERVAGRFAGFGAWLLAAEACAEAAALHEAAGDLTEAARCAALSLAAELLCERPQTPALDRRPKLVSPREAEVALDAATGLTSPAIAAQHFISVRTVDNHLSSVYRKLGLSGREELADVLSPVAGRLPAPAGDE